MTVEWRKVPNYVLELANEIIAEHHPSLMEFNIGFIFRSEASTSGGKQVVGQAAKSPAKLAPFIDLDGLVWLAENYWLEATPIQKRALIDHELCHFQVNDAGELTLRGHDIEEFKEIIERYGLWSLDLHLIAPAFVTATQAKLPGFERLRKQGASSSRRTWHSRRNLTRQPGRCIMSNRCPNCNKFVSLELQEPELNLEIEGDAVTGSVRLVLACAECGSEVKEADLDIYMLTDHHCDREEDDFEIVEESAEPTEHYQDKDRHGQPIKNPRYQRHYYGAEVSVIIRCGHCGEEFDITDTIEEQASGFDDLC